MNMRRIRGAVVRSGVNWYEEGETDFKFFLNLENNHKAQSTIRKLKDGITTTNPKNHG